MELEYQQVYVQLRTSGTSVSDGAPLDSALFEYEQTVARWSARVIGGVGVLRNSAQ
jgi:hypothetical protein